MNDKSAGWYYIGDGTLRYRDDYGWTEYYMDTKDPRAQDWPPPKPKTLLQQLREDEAIAAADTILLTVPNQLGVDYNTHLIESILTHVAPGLGWR